MHVFCSPKTLIAQSAGVSFSPFNYAINCGLECQIQMSSSKFGIPSRSVASNAIRWLNRSCVSAHNECRGVCEGLYVRLPRGIFIRFVMTKLFMLGVLIRRWKLEQTIDQ